MARNQYSWQKRQKELAKKQKREEKLARKLAKKQAAAEEADSDAAAAASSDDETDGAVADVEIPGEDTRRDAEHSQPTDTSP